MRRRLPAYPGYVLYLSPWLLSAFNHSQQSFYIYNKALETFPLPFCCVKLNGDGTAAGCCFMIPHGPLILLRIFITHLASFPQCNRSISPDRTLTIVCCYGVSERAKCIFPRWRKRPFILTCNFFGVSRPTAAGFLSETLGSHQGY